MESLTVLSRLRGHRFATPLLAAVLAGTVAVAVAALGGPRPYPLIVGLATAVPVLNLTSSGERFDVDAYASDRGRGGVALDVVLSAVSGTLLGSLAASIALRWGWSGLLLVGVSTIGTIGGGIGIFVFRNAAYYRNEPD